MTYVTKQDLVDRFGADELVELTDRFGDNDLDDDALNRAIADADDEINTYLATRYRLPLASVPRVLNRIAADITRYYLYEQLANEIVTRRYNDAVKFLRAVANGTASLGLDLAGAEVNQDGTAVEFAGATPVFGRGDTEGF